MKELELPFNVTQMSEEDKKEFIDRINSGKEEILLEKRGDNGSIIVDQILSAGNLDRLITKKLEDLRDLIRDFKLCIFSKDRQQAISSLNLCKENMKRILNYKIYSISDMEDFIEAISYSYDENKKL